MPHPPIHLAALLQALERLAPFGVGVVEDRLVGGTAGCGGGGEGAEVAAVAGGRVAGLHFLGLDGGVGAFCELEKASETSG